MVGVRDSGTMETVVMGGDTEEMQDYGGKIREEDIQVDEGDSIRHTRR